MNQLKIFREISIGGITKDQLIKQLVNANIQFNNYAKILFEHKCFAAIDKSEEVKLVKLTLCDLSMSNPCSFQGILNQALALGLKVCPLYCAAFLRLKYLDQPAGPFLTIVSNKPVNDETYPNGFYLRNFDNLLWVRGYRATDFCEWPLDNEFVFLK